MGELEKRGKVYLNSILQALYLVLIITYMKHRKLAAITGVKDTHLLSLYISYLGEFDYKFT